MTRAGRGPRPTWRRARPAARRASTPAASCAPAQTTLGFLREATFAAEVKVNPTGGFRRLWDWKIRGGNDADGFLIDLTPAGNVRFIASGRNVGTDAVLPTGRFVDLVVTAGRDGKINVYADGVRIGGADLARTGIFPRVLRPRTSRAEQARGDRQVEKAEHRISAGPWCRSPT